MGSLGAIGSGKRIEPDLRDNSLRTRRWPLLLVGGWILQVIIRLVIAAPHAAPLLIPDETGYLLGARLLAGGVAGDLSGFPLYPAGYSLLISPAFWISDDPTTVYRLVIAINSMVGAFFLVLAYVALRRLNVPRAPAYVLATVTALLPSVTYYGLFAMADAVLPVVVLGWLLLVHSWIGGGRWAYGAAASAVAAYAYCVHSRGSVIVLAQAGLLLVVLWRRWAGKRDIAVVTAVLVAASAAGWALNGWVKSRIYPDGISPLGDRLINRLTSLDGLGWTLGLTAGKIWYLIVSSWGVAGVGLIAVGLVAVRRGTPRATRATAWLVLVTLTGIALGSSAAVPDEGSVGNFAYGRYLCCLVPVLFMAGAVFAVRGTPRTAARVVLTTAALTLATAGIVWWHAGVRLSRSFFPVFDFPEVDFLTWSWDRLRLWLATGIALLLLTGAGLLVARSRRIGPPAVAAAFIGLNVGVVAVVTDRVTVPWDRRLAAVASLAPAGLRPQDHVAVGYAGLQWRIWVPQAFEVRTGLERLDRNRQETLPPDATLVVVPWNLLLRPESSWPAAPPGWKPASIRLTDAGDWVAWRRGG